MLIFHSTLLFQVASSCPFLFPFETRQLLFYVNSFDRDRAMMRLQVGNNYWYMQHYRLTLRKDTFISFSHRIDEYIVLLDPIVQICILYLSQEASTDTMDMDNSGRVAPPRLEKRKKTISRENLVKQAEHIFDDIGKSKALLGEYSVGLSVTKEDVARCY